MIKVLLDSKKNYYKANMHCHSAHSDGKRTVEQIKEDFLKEGYSVVAFTDHEHLVDNSHLNDENFLAITACEIAIKEFPDQSTLKNLDMKVCHLNLYSRSEHNINTPCYSSIYDHYVSGETRDKIIVPEKDYERVYGASGINEIIRIANEQGFLVSYNHPRWSLEDARDYLGYNGLWAIELFNNTSFVDGYFDYNINAYDEFLREGEKLACIAGDDNHRLDTCFGGYIMINAEKLTYDSVMDALSKHNFYASTGARINGLYIDGNTAHISVPDGEKIVMVSAGRRRTVKYLKDEKNLDDIVFEFKDDCKYIRFEVTDKSGKTASTCAYFI